MAQKTAIITRYHVWGTWRHALQVSYRVRILSYWKNGYPQFLGGLEDTQNEIDRLCTIAKEQGFTHVRFAGDWSKSSQPKNRKL
jgi:hypothetical protein